MTKLTTTSARRSQTALFALTSDLSELEQNFSILAVGSSFEKASAPPLAMICSPRKHDLKRLFRDTHQIKPHNFIHFPLLARCKSSLSARSEAYNSFGARSCILLYAAGGSCFGVAHFLCIILCPGKYYAVIRTHSAINSCYQW